MKGLTLSVAQLNEYVRKSFAADPMLRQICLTGEISNFKMQASGHWYFSLKDEEAAIACVVFRQAAGSVRFRPENGMHVRLYGSVGLYAKTGSYQFYGDMMEQEGRGELYLRFEALKRQLMTEGLFDVALKKPLPLLPKGIGIITSRTGAVIHDIARVAWRRHPGMLLYLSPVKVQGDGAALEIAAAIELMDRLEQVDVLIVGRGGGSMEDLWAFNEEIVARAIFACHKPVVSAIGHETDFTIADFISDLRAPTPSAAAEMCVPTRESILDQLFAQGDRMQRCLASRMDESERTLERLHARIEQSAPEHRLTKNALELKLLENRLQTALDARVQASSYRLERALTKLRALGPADTLRRGYAVVRKDGAPIQSVSKTVLGDALVVQMYDGSLRVGVTGIEMGE